MASRTAIQVSRYFLDLMMLCTEDVIVVGECVVELLQDGQCRNPGREAHC